MSTGAAILHTRMDELYKRNPTADLHQNSQVASYTFILHIDMDGYMNGLM